MQLEGEIVSDEDLFRERWRRRHLTEEQIDRKWQEFWELEGYRHHLEGQHKPNEEINRRVQDRELSIMRRRT